jgi:hypothetical protein
MPQVLIAGLVVAHGLITTMIGFGGITRPEAPAMAVPAWIGWWPGPFGRSWLIDALQLGPGASMIGSALWLAAGLALLAAGLGLLGVPGLSGVWQPLALGGAAVGLIALALFFHPFYLVAILVNVAIVVLLSGALAPTRWS